MLRLLPLLILTGCTPARWVLGTPEVTCADVPENAENWLIWAGGSLVLIGTLGIAFALIGFGGLLSFPGRAVKLAKWSALTIAAGAGVIFFGEYIELVVVTCIVCVLGYYLVRNRRSLLAKAKKILK